MGNGKRRIQTLYTCIDVDGGSVTSVIEQLEKVKQNLGDISINWECNDCGTSEVDMVATDYREETDEEYRKRLAEADRLKQIKIERLEKELAKLKGGCVE